MNREIKFRLWDSLEKEMIYVRPKDDLCFGLMPAQGLVPMQYTGLKDKNGEIYEGGIRREETEHDDGDEINYYVCVWINEWSMFAWLHLPGEYQNYMDNGVEHLDTDMYWTYPAGSDEENKIIVCGNIYENAELLE